MSVYTCVLESIAGAAECSQKSLISPLQTHLVPYSSRKGAFIVIPIRKPQQTKTSHISQSQPHGGLMLSLSTVSSYDGITALSHLKVN